MDQVQQLFRSRPVSPPPQAIRVLLLDDNRVDRLRIERFCRDGDLEIDLVQATSLVDFAEALDGAPFDVFLIDYRLGEGDGLIALEVLNRHPGQRSGTAIMVAGEGQIQVAIDAMKAGCRDFLLKDHLTADVLARALSRALEAEDHAPAFPAARSDGARRFAEENAAEMRAILSAMLRHVRSLRHAGGPRAALDGVEASTARLWNFLEGLKAAGRDRAVPPALPERLN